MSAESYSTLYGVLFLLVFIFIIVIPLLKCIFGDDFLFPGGGGGAGCGPTGGIPFISSPRLQKT
jgi:hypothetical protein